MSEQNVQVAEQELNDVVENEVLEEEVVDVAIDNEHSEIIEDNEIKKVRKHSFLDGSLKVCGVLSCLTTLILFFNIII